MAFKMRSGNKPEFKEMGSSPMKMDPTLIAKLAPVALSAMGNMAKKGGEKKEQNQQEQSQAPQPSKSMNQMIVEGAGKVVKKPAAMKMTLADQAMAKEAYYGSEASEEAPVAKSKKELRQQRRLEKKQARLDAKRERLDREAQERAEDPTLGKAEQFARRVRDWGEKKGETWLGRHARKAINTLIDPTSTDVGLMLQAGRAVKNRLKQKATGQLGPEEKLMIGEGGLLGVGKNLIDTIRGRAKSRKEARRAEAEGNAPLTKKKKYKKK